MKPIIFSSSAFDVIILPTFGGNTELNPTEFKVNKITEVFRSPRKDAPVKGIMRLMPSLGDQWGEL